ncbi:MAG: hypothetical protein JO217_09300 [Acidobacteriaceae bacterium]|nr:hypothetical protein [Acidobacteriaceae bacterium]
MNIVLDLIEAFRRSKTMFAAVRLGIFDQLEHAPQTASALARALQLHEAAAARLLDACASLGLLEKHAQEYRNTQVASTYLVSDSEDTLSGYIKYSDESLYHLWSHLDDAVREGSNRWEQTFGARDALFDHYYRDPEKTANFMQGMNGFGCLSSPTIVRAFDLSRYRHLVDLGGGTGHLPIAACQVYPDLRATIFDLPKVEPISRRFISNSSVANRIEFVAGDFFRDPLPGGDLYSLGRIIHDWDDPRIVPLLRKVFDALPSNGALLIQEALVQDDRSGPVCALMQDLNMLVCTDGRERTEAEYKLLLETAGFSDVQLHRTGAPLDAVLAVKR